jgi:hypothetical protein
MRLWAFALDIAHATRMKIVSVMRRLCRGVTAFGNPVRSAVQGTSERVQSAAVRPICQIARNSAAFSPRNSSDEFTDQTRTTPPGPPNSV